TRAPLQQSAQYGGSGGSSTAPRSAARSTCRSSSLGCHSASVPSASATRVHVASHAPRRRVEEISRSFSIVTSETNCYAAPLGGCDGRDAASDGSDRQFRERTQPPHGGGRRHRRRWSRASLRPASQRAGQDQLARDRVGAGGGEPRRRAAEEA